MSESELVSVDAEHEIVNPVSVDAPDDEEATGRIALSLSGGGYRAMLFHLGALWRLNDGGWLSKIDTIASVSGGSMASAILGVNWNWLSFDSRTGVADNFREVVAEPMYELAALNLAGRFRMTLRVLNAFKRASQSVADQLDKAIFKGADFSALPDEGPEFVFKATSLHDGVLWLFTKERLGDYKIGYIKNHRARLADAVIASAAFPPFLSPFEFKGRRTDFRGGATGPPGDGEKVGIHLTDGGVYDNLGLERAFKNHRMLFVSDASGVTDRVTKTRRNWLGHLKRVTAVINNQVRSLRRRQLIAAFKRPIGSGGREGCYWSTTSDPENFPKSATLVPVDDEVREYLARISTDLRVLSDFDRQRLVNWGYVITDVAINSWVPEPPPGEPYKVPYPAVPLGS